MQFFYLWLALILKLRIMHGLFNLGAWP